MKHRFVSTGHQAQRSNDTCDARTIVSKHQPHKNDDERTEGRLSAKTSTKFHDNNIDPIPHFFIAIRRKTLYDESRPSIDGNLL
jgi:hypothetical protein